MKIETGETVTLETANGEAFTLTREADSFVIETKDRAAICTAKTKVRNLIKAYETFGAAIVTALEDSESP